MNVVMTADEQLVEVQGTAEQGTFDRAAARRARRSGDRRDRAAGRRAATGARGRARVKRLAFASGNRHKLAEIAAHAARRTAGRSSRWRSPSTRTRRPSRATPRRRRARRWRHRACRRSPTTAGSRSTRSTARPACSSARYAGAAGDDARQQRQAARARSRGVPDARRTARFRCALVFVDADGTRLRQPRAPARGASARRRAAAGGFGYDPLFLVDARRRRPHHGRAARRRRRTASRTAPRRWRKWPRRWSNGTGEPLGRPRTYRPAGLGHGVVSRTGTGTMACLTP